LIVELVGNNQNRQHGILVLLIICW